MYTAKMYRRLTRLFYVMGVVMMLTGTLLSMVRVPVLADDPPPAPEVGDPLEGEGGLIEDPTVTVEPPPPEMPALPVDLGFEGLRAASQEEEEELVPLAQLEEKIDGDPSGILGADFTFPLEPGTTVPAGVPFNFYKSSVANPDGTCTYGGGVVTCFWDMPVTSAVNYSGDYGTIVIEDGTYVEGTISISKPIILQAGGPNVVLQSTDPTLVEILNTHNVVLIGLTIDGQNVPGVKGVVIVDSGDVTLFANKIINNEVGVLIDGTGTGKVDLARNEFDDNDVAVQIDAAADGAVRIMENTFGVGNTQNLVDNSGADGFAIYDNEWGYIDWKGDYKSCWLGDVTWDTNLFQTCAKIFGTLNDAFDKDEFMRSSAGNSGSIWTTDGTCGTSQQDVNHFNVGDDVYINGKNFKSNYLYVWSIEGKPGGASADPNLYVMGGIFETDDEGDFCFKAYTVNRDDAGEYQVKFGKKGDNYRVKDAEKDGVTLSYICSTDGLNLDWYVQNNTNKNLNIYWSLDSNSYNNETIVPKNSSVLLTTTTTGEHTVYLKWKEQNVNVSTTAFKLAAPAPTNYQWKYLELTSDFFACRLLKDITVEQVCTENDQIEWKVTNPNSFSIKVDWTLKDSGNNTVASGSGDTVGAGATVTLHTSSLGVFTLTVHVTDPFISKYFNLTSDEDTCYEPAALTLDKACELDQTGKPTGRIVWTVNNPNDREITFAVNGASPIEPGPYSVAANGSTSFTTGNGSALSVTVSFEFGGSTFTSNEVTSEEGECEAPPLPLTLGYACELVEGRYTGNVIWTVNNPNNMALQFTVNNITTVESQPINIAALGSATFTTADDVGASVTVTFSYGDPTENYTSEAVQLTAYECTEPQDIYITYYCGLENGNGINDDVAFGSAKLAKALLLADTIVWYVVNPNPYAVDVEVILDGFSQGNFNIPGNSSVQFQTGSGEHNLVANWDDENSTSSTSDIDTCVPPQPLQLSYLCIPGSSGAIAWSVLNPNLVPVEFNFYLDQDPPVAPDGNMVVGAGETVEIAITSGGAHLVTIAWLYGGENVLSEESPADFCLPPDGGGDPGGDPLPPPGAGEVGGAGGAVLIPVTGADRSGMLNGWLINLGLVFLGAAFVLTALTRRQKAPYA